MASPDTRLHIEGHAPLAFIGADKLSAELGNSNASERKQLLTLREFLRAMICRRGPKPLNLSVPAALASKLGLTAEALKDKMAKGLVTSVSETGRDEDAGRMRLTFRYRARVWRVVVEADGTLVEDPVPAGKPGHAKDPFSLLDLARDAS